MKKEGMVSLWIGETESAERLDSYLKMKFSEDGAALGSEFSVELGFNHIDEDFVESEIIDRTRDLWEALMGFSYDGTVTRNFVDKIGKILNKEINTVLLIYNFEYSEEKVDFTDRGFCLHYMGAVPYR